MPPTPVKKGSATKKQRLSISKDFDEKVWDATYVPKEKFVMIYPNTQTVCGCCFSSVEDMSQHTKQNACCALYMACRIIMAGFRHNDNEEDAHFHVEPTVVSTMLADPNCPVNVIDIITQAPGWDPTEPFTDERRRNHVCAPELVDKTFKELYKDYIRNNRRMKSAVPDIVHEAVDKATGYDKFPSALQSAWDAETKRHVRKLIRDQKVFPARDIDDMVEEEVEEEIQKQVDAGTLFRDDQRNQIIQEGIQAEIAAGTLFRDDQRNQIIQEGIQAEIAAGNLKRTRSSSQGGE